MSLLHRISSIFTTQRPTASQLHLVNENQPLQDLKQSNLVELKGSHPIGERGLEKIFQEKVSYLGGRESILLVGEAGYNSQNVNDCSGILQELSYALFQSPEKVSIQEDEAEIMTGEQSNKGTSCYTSRAPSKSRIIQFPVILVIFRVALIMDLTNSNLIREVLKDVKVRIRDSRSVLVGLIYSNEEMPEETNMEAKLHFGKLIGQVFKRQSWGICSYISSNPETILEVKRTIKETVDGKEGGQNQDQHGEHRTVDLERSFTDLVCRLGGKEKFLLVGNICPSARPSERALVFKEVANALFGGEARPKRSGGLVRLTTGKEGGSSIDCTRLPKPRSFPYPLILVIIRSAFLKEEGNKAQVKEILVDIKLRAKRPCTQVIGVVCSLEDLQEEEWQRYHYLLSKLIQQTLGGPVAVCSYIRSRPESVEEVKKCVCDCM